jgi:hypothetical protein
LEVSAMSDERIFYRSRKGGLCLGPYSWCCTVCGIGAGIPAEVKRRGRSNKGDGYCYAEDRPSVFIWTQTGPEGVMIR